MMKTGIALTQKKIKEIPKCKDATIDIRDQVGYWRKANQIFRWFENEYIKNSYRGVDGFPNCGRFEVSLEQLKALRDICTKILEDPSKAEELLPARDGFFFGSLEYDEGYKYDLENTIKIVNDILLWEENNKAPGWSVYYEYTADW